MSAPRLARNRSGVAQVRDHLSACAAAFVPPLASRVSIPHYAEKLVARAERFEAWDAGSTLVGLVAVYCDAPDRREAFVTSVSVLPAWTRRGLGRGLMRAALAHVRHLGFGRLALSVDRAAPALDLYRGLGFMTEAQQGALHPGEMLRLSIDLHGKALS